MSQVERQALNNRYSFLWRFLLGVPERMPACGGRSDEVVFLLI
jgi:hypothetical protein